MQPIELNMAVLAVDDLRVGQVTAVRRCCFQVQAANPADQVSLKAESIFSVDTGRVTLVCSAAEVGRYVCPAHRK